MRKHFDNFDMQFVQMERTMKRGICAAFVLWFIWMLVVLCGIAGIAYVAWHFISKYW